MPPPIAIQLYTLREEFNPEVDQEVVAMLKKVAKMGFLGVELAGTYKIKRKEFRKIVEDLGLKMIGDFVPVIEQSNANAILDEQEEIGNHMLISGFEAEDCKTIASLKKCASQLNEMVRLASQRGMRVEILNHWWEFQTKIEGKTAHQHLMEQADPSILADLDIYWVQTAGEDPTTVLRSLGKRATSIHVKDGPCDNPDHPQVAVGKGKVDIQKVLSISKAEWHNVELDKCATDMFQAVEESYRFLIDHNLASGRV